MAGEVGYREREEKGHVRADDAYEVPATAGGAGAARPRRRLGRGIRPGRSVPSSPDPNDAIESGQRGD
jgi:hypothetical protein